MKWKALLLALIASSAIATTINAPVNAATGDLEDLTAVEATTGTVESVIADLDASMRHHCDWCWRNAEANCPYGWYARCYNGGRACYFACDPPPGTALTL
ncbi:MAG TPA: hypothetical protein VNZ52_14355 [Candidatus Thermoplasmatota archaeon]|nr:hypothetical protein [Candidatus Thermoplasmatota archaeon]